MAKFAFQKNLRWFERKRDGLLKQLAKTKVFVDGSLVTIARTCGSKEHCKCGRGEKHVSYYLTFSIRGKTHTIYVPVDLESKVAQWCKEYRNLKKTIREISKTQKEIIKNYVRNKKGDRK